MLFLINEENGSGNQVLISVRYDTGLPVNKYINDYF